MATTSSVREATKSSMRAAFLFKGSHVFHDAFLSANCCKNPGFFGGDRAVDLQASVGPVPDPIAIVKIGMAGIAIAYERLVMATARAQGPRPAGMAIVFGVDVAAASENRLASRGRCLSRYARARARRSRRNGGKARCRRRVLRPAGPMPAPQGCDLFTPWHSSASVSLTLEKPCDSPRKACSRYSSARMWN